MRDADQQQASRRSVVKSIGVAGVAAAGLGVGAGSGAAETGTLTDGATYKLLNLKTSNALDILYAGLTDGVPAQQYDYVAGASQQWTAVAVGDGHYKLVNENSGKVLEAPNDDNGTRLEQNSDAGSTTQQWSITETGAGVYKMTNRSSGKVAEVSPYDSSNGSAVKQWDDGAGRNQRWVVLPVGQDTDPDVTLSDDDRFTYDGIGYVKVDVTNNERDAIAINPTVETTDGVLNPNQGDIVVPAGETRRITVDFTGYDSVGNIDLTLGDEYLILQQVPYLQFPNTSV